MNKRKLYAILAGLALLASMLACNTMETSRRYADSFATQATWKCSTYGCAATPVPRATPVR